MSEVGSEEICSLIDRKVRLCCDVYSFGCRNAEWAGLFGLNSCKSSQVQTCTGMGV